MVSQILSPVSKLTHDALDIAVFMSSSRRLHATIDLSVLISVSLMSPLVRASVRSSTGFVYSDFVSTDKYLFRHIISLKYPDIKAACVVCALTSFLRSRLSARFH